MKVFDQLTAISKAGAYDALLPQYQQLQDAMRLLESLTPGGSEYVNDPERCAKFVKDNWEDLSTLHKKSVKENKALKEALGNLLSEVGDIDGNAWEEMKAAIHNHNAKKKFVRIVKEAHDTLHQSTK